MTRQRRKFDTIFKLDVVRMIKEQGLSVQHASESMNLVRVRSDAGRRNMKPSKVGSVASAIHSRTNNNASASLSWKTANCAWMSIF
ncbi:MAG TPA: hypothetical protein DEQ40_17975 [Oxalobacteraceae bacterium]|jgi:transposase-like protein|nr:hypothetical protein [Oxalobacteraceae bacterium]